ncbi:universal stress protein [Natrinema halophilum]|nr:universal stress protein [Natrinema halophilum]
MPTDGSDSSEAAVGEALEIADRNATTADFLYVVNAGAEMSAGPSGSIAPQLTETLEEEEAESTLDSATNEADGAGVNYDRITIMYSIRRTASQQSVVEFAFTDRLIPIAFRTAVPQSS